VPSRASLLKRALHWIGGGLALLGVIFVVLRLKDHASQIDFTRFRVADWVILAGLSVVYGAANILLALAWRNLLEFCGARTEPRWAIRAYGISQLAKYVPGNIFHFAGRQAIGAAAGVPGWPLARSALWELGLIAVVGAFFALLVTPLLLEAVSSPLAVALFAALLVGAYWTTSRLLSRPVAEALGQQATFLAISGMVFVFVLALASSSLEIGYTLWPTICGAYVIAWLAGLVTPGAPAGIGVRELVLLFLMSGLVSEPDLLLAVLLGRIVSVAGDTMFFSGAWLLPKGDHDG
jgi:glycosyltransferase 2 family protein